MTPRRGRIVLAAAWMLLALAAILVRRWQTPEAAIYAIGWAAGVYLIPGVLSRLITKNYHLPTAIIGLAWGAALLAFH